jgi:hypothetical protein
LASTTRIATPAEYLSEIVEPDVKECLCDTLDLRKAFHACISLFSLRDWVVAAHSRKVWTYNQVLQNQFHSRKSLQAQLVRIEPSFLVVSNVANSAKHMFLKTGWNWKRMEGSANVVVHSTAGTVSGGPVSAAPVSGSADLIVADLGGQLRDVVACITDVHLLWKVLFAENNW